MRDVRSGWGWFLALGILMIVVGMIAIGTPMLMTLAMELLLGWLLIFAGIAEVIHAFSSRGWGGFVLQLIIGALTAVAGFVLLSYPLAGAVTLTLVLAIYLLVEGSLRVVMGFQLRPQPGSGWIIVGGIVTLVLGGMIYAEWPLSGAWVIGLLVGIHLIFDGWAMVATAFALRAARATEGGALHAGR